MEIKNSNSTSNINCKKCSKKFGYIIDTSYSTSESGFRNKAIKKNNSSKNFIKNNLKLTNNISKSNSERRVMTTLSSSDIDHIKQNILQHFVEYKSKNLTEKNSSSINKSKINKRNKRNKIDNIMNKIEKKFEKYNTENMAYKVYHDYQKINITEEKYDELNFLDRMKINSIKRELKEKTINEYIRLKSPKLPNSKIKQVFDNLINDVNIRKQKKEKQEKEELNFFKFNNNNNNLKNKKVSQKEINEIVKRLNKPKKHFFYYNINKDIINKDIKLRNGGKEKENKNINEVNKVNNKKKIIPKSNSMKSIKKSEQINNIVNRLYKKEMDKKDRVYKLFMQNVNELIGNYNNVNNIKSKIKENNDYISYEQLQKMRNNNNKLMNIKSMKNIRNKKDEYKFKEDEDDSDNIKNNKVEYKGNNNNYKGIKTFNNYNNTNYNELFTFSKPQTNNSINNLKISIMIDNFFCNK